MLHLLNLIHYSLGIPFEVGFYLGFYLFLIVYISHMNILNMKWLKAQLHLSTNFKR
jgi:hypothetical protein